MKNLIKSLHAFKYIIIMFLMIFFVFFADIKTVSAKSPVDVENKINRVSKGKTNNDVFSHTTTQTLSLGTSGYRLVLAIGIVGSILSLIACAIGWVWNKSSQKYQENKDWLVRIAGGCLIIFGSATIISMCYSIFSSIKF